MFSYSLKYDIITAIEKQATRSGICFSAVINEKAFDEVKHGVRKHELSSLDNIMYANALSTAALIMIKQRWRYGNGSRQTSGGYEQDHYA